MLCFLKEWFMALLLKSKMLGRFVVKSERIGQFQNNIEILKYS